MKETITTGTTTLQDLQKKEQSEGKSNTKSNDVLPIVTTTTTTYPPSSSSSSSSKPVIIREDKIYRPSEAADPQSDGKF